VTTPQNILEIEMLLNAHVFSAFKPVRSDAHKEALDRLASAGMVKLNYDNTITTTLRGQFWISHLLNIPYPVEKYEIPQA